MGQLVRSEPGFVMYSLDDTIVAISTPVGQGGIGIVRLTGPEALGIVLRLFRPAGRRRQIEPNHLYYGHIVAPPGEGWCGPGDAVDEVLLSYMRAPHTYTRQDVVEINAHGGIMPLRGILALCLESGARLARAGEFTLRAFLNGRIDLAQAEAVLDIVNARTETSLRMAEHQLGGRLSQRVRGVRSGLLDILAYLEAAIDFPEDELPPRQIGLDLQRAEQELIDLLREADRGIIYRQGLRVAIVGRPNVGKSSLLNALLRTERAIVTPIPGTTRDTLEETLNLQGIPLVLVDTAGIGKTDDLIERLGAERSRSSAQQADVVLWVVDSSVPPTREDSLAAELAVGKPAIVVLNKSDLPATCEDMTCRVSLYANLLPGAPCLAVSAQTGAGLLDLEALLLQMILSGEIVSSTEPLVSNPRHRDLFRRAYGHLTEAQRSLAQPLPADLLAIDISEAINALGEVTGETASEDLLERIFASFCIGK